MSDNEYTYSASAEFDLLPDGDYEVFVEDLEIKVTTTDKKYLNIKYRIRDDIEEQQYKRRVLFEKIWQEKENPQFINRQRINKLLGTQEFEDGKTFANIKDVMDNLRNVNLIVHVKKSFNEYRQEDENVVVYYKKTKHGEAKFKDPFANVKPSSEVGGDDIPF